MLKPGIKSILDLGQVFVAAEIIVNGCNLGMSWMYPYTVDISNSLRVGNNDIEIRVTNQWSNRLIGDEMFPDQSGGYKLDGARPTGKMPQWYINNEPMPEGPRTTFCTGQFYKKGDPLMPSGLLGPVKIKFKKTIILN